MAEKLKSVLFVDFDNIALSIRDADRDAARAFVSKPLSWINAIESGELVEQEDGETRGRRILMRRCYANPKLLGDYRAAFTRTGFQIIDCPPLTGHGKNSADIYMVMDIIDALAHPTRFDEFIILSSDADFTPVLTRLRAFDRRSVIYSNAVTAAAYRSLCDGQITDASIIDLLGATEAEAERRRPRAIRQPQASAGAAATSNGIGNGPPARVAAPVAPPAAATTEAAAPRDPELNVRLAEAVIDGVVRAVVNSEKPVVLSQLANDAREAIGKDLIDETRWAGFGSFRALLDERLPAGYTVGGRQPGYLYDMSRHELEPSDTPRPAETVNTDEPAIAASVLPEGIAKFAAQISEVTGVPYLTPETYAALFMMLCQEIRLHGFSLNRVVKAVATQLAAQGHRVSGNAIAFVVRGITMTQHRFGDNDTPESLAKAFQKQVYHLVRRNGRNLNDEERKQIGWWLRSRLRAGAPGTVDAAVEVISAAAGDDEMHGGRDDRAPARLADAAEADAAAGHDAGAVDGAGDTADEAEVGVDATETVGGSGAVAEPAAAIGDDVETDPAADLYAADPSDLTPADEADPFGPVPGGDDADTADMDEAKAEVDAAALDDVADEAEDDEVADDGAGLDLDDPNGEVVSKPKPEDAPGQPPVAAWDEVFDTLLDQLKHGGR
ncbi:MAG: NYN domain-containing protein [Hyphomicrobiaceae bacterium]|nr:NYN domain-containing protein [Hyphomicrobiaceae bacterium]